MGIQTNKAKVTIDFIWSGNAGDGEIEYQIKYHHTDDFGPTVSISTDGGSDYYGFPADMFSEIVDFLRGEKMLKPSTAQHVSNQEEMAPKVTKKTLPIPVVDGKKETAEPTSVEPFEVTADPMQSFGDSPENEESVEDQNEEEPKPQIKKKAKEEIDAQQASLERTAAVRRANENKDKKKIRRDTKADEKSVE